MLELEGVNTFRGPAHVLRDVHLRVGDAESVCLVGRNGAGKTTTIDSIMGLLPMRSGRIRLGDQDVTRESTRASSRSSPRCRGSSGAGCSSPGGRRRWWPSPAR